jgi:hypothetical protein
MAAVPLKRIGGIGRVAMLLVATTSAASVAAVAITATVTDDARAFLDGEIDRDDFLTSVAPFALVSFLQALSLLASAVLVIVWMHRLARNLRTLHRDTTWGPGWAIGGWFAPPVLYVIPYLTFRELWKASDPEVPVGGTWRSNPVSPLVTAWFVVFGPVQLALQLAQIGDTFSGLGAGETAMAEQITGSLAIPTIAAAVDVLAAGLFIAMARRLGDRHRRLTGETV